MPTPEGKLKKDIKMMLRARGASYFPIPGGAYGMSGAPDMIACYKGRFIGIEGKTYEGRQSQEQKEREQWIKVSGGIYVLARRVRDVEEVLDGVDEEIEGRVQEAGVHPSDGL